MTESVGRAERQREKEREREREREGVAEVEATGLKGRIQGAEDRTGMAKVTFAHRRSIKSADSGCV